MTLPLRSIGDAVQFAVKVVPGASRDRIVGVLGDALKVQVTAPPERGKANAALCALLAQALGVAVRAIRVTAGAGSPQKTVAVVGVSPAVLRMRLGLPD